MTAALEGGEWSAAGPGRTLPTGKTRYPFYRRLSGPQGRSGRAENLVPTGILSQTVQLVVSRYIDWATRHTAVQSKCSKIPPSTSMHFSTLLATVRVAFLRSSWRSYFMRAALFIMRATNSSLVFTFSL